MTRSTTKKGRMEKTMIALQEGANTEQLIMCARKNIPENRLKNAF